MSSAFTAPAITIRPATHEDLAEIARLLLQLYDAELPGALIGEPRATQRLLQFTLETNNQQGLVRRYVAADQHGTILATGAMDLPGHPSYDRAPNGTISNALQWIGLWPTLRLLLTVAQSLLGGYQQRPADSAFLHSVVVDASQRGRKIGQALLTKLEATAQDQGYAAVQLQVLASNVTARKFYERSGYQNIWQSPSWANRFSWPSYVMRKPLSTASSHGTLQPAKHRG